MPQPPTDLSLSGRDPFRSPDWRWQEAAAALGRRSRRRRPSSDVLIDEATQYLKLAGGGVGSARKASQKYPDVARAAELHAETAVREKLQILTIAACDPTEIAERLGLSPSTLRIWEQLYFDVREASQASDWIRTHVFGPVEESGNHALAARLKLAWSTGPVAARLILQADAQALLPAAQRLAERKLRMQLRFDEIEALLGDAIDPEHCLFAYAEFQLAERKLALEREKLEARCVAAQQRHELMRLRLERLLERERRAAAPKSPNDRPRGESSPSPGQRAADEALLLEAGGTGRPSSWQARAAASPLAALQWSSSLGSSPPERPGSGSESASVNRRPQIQGAPDLQGTPPSRGREELQSGCSMESPRATLLLPLRRCGPADGRNDAVGVAS